MKTFEKRQLREALAYSAEGGQALHLHNVIVNKKRAPICFRRAVSRGETIAHLFDQDYRRLVATAKRFGVNRIYVERLGQPGQHVDLVGIPLTKAIFLCEDPEFYHAMFES